MCRIQEVSGGQWHWLMRFWGALPSDGRNAEVHAGYSNTGYGIVKAGSKVIGLVTRYDYDNPRYFVDSCVFSSVSTVDIGGGVAQASVAMVI